MRSHRFLPLLLLACSPARGQFAGLGDFNPLSTDRSGVHLYGASVSGAFFSGGYGIGMRTVAPDLAPRQAGMMQGSAAFGWSRQGANRNMSMVYSPSFVRGLNSSYYSLNHALSVSSGAALTTKWYIAAGANAIISDFSQLLFARSQPASIASVTASFEDLFAAVTTGRSQNPLLTQTVAAAPVRNSPETAFLYGDRLLTASASLSASYARTTRSTFSFGIQAARSQQFRRGSNLPESSSSFVIPRSTGGSVNVGWSYSLNPRTTIGVSGSASRTFSQFQDAWVQQASVSFGRTLTRRWFVQASGGGGTIRPVRQVFRTNRNVQLHFGGGIGVRTYSHTLLASFQRSLADIYGLGANTMDMSGGGWVWRRPGSTVSVSASAGYSKLRGPEFSNPGSWMANAGVGKALNAHLAVSVGFSYTQFPSSVFASLSNTTQKGVVASLSWSPAERR